jgi:CO dehydrogenase/acetyl-CoA synthase alpha subunit
MHMLTNCIASAVSGNEAARNLYDSIIVDLSQMNIDPGAEIQFSSDAIVIVAGVSPFGGVYCNIHTLQ